VGAIFEIYGIRVAKVGEDTYMNVNCGALRTYPITGVCVENEAGKYVEVIFPKPKA